MSYTSSDTSSSDTSYTTSDTSSDTSYTTSDTDSTSDIDSDDSFIYRTNARSGEVKLSVKVMINKQKTKVLFAEVDSHFADVLLSFLTLPMGKIVKILEKHCRDKSAAVGSLTTLYRGIANLGYDLMSWRKHLLLDPQSSSREECQKLKLDVGATKPATKCTKKEGRGYCKRRRSPYVRPAPRAKSTTASKTQALSVYTANTSSFIISDDLRIAPVVPGSIVQTLMSIGITDTEGAELKTVTFGFNEIKDLLKGSLVSETPLTDIVLHKSSSSKKKGVKGDLVHKMENRPSTSSKKMVVKAMVQKSTNKLLIVQAGEDFVEFLFSFLVIPLGVIERLLGSNTCLKNIDNLYSTLAGIDDKYMSNRYKKTMLLRPKLPEHHIPGNHILRNFIVEGGSFPSRESLSTKYVKGPAMFNVSDDLTVTPFCLASSLSVLNGLKVPLSDVKEMDLQIGVEEAFNILKASLTSTSALSDGLNNSILKKQPKQER